MAPGEPVGVSVPASLSVYDTVLAHELQQPPRLIRDSAPWHLCVRYRSSQVPRLPSFQKSRTP